MDFTEVLQAESAADSSFRKIRRIQDKFKSRLSASHTQYAKRILQMKRETHLTKYKPLNYFDKKPSSIPPVQSSHFEVFTSHARSNSGSSSSSDSIEWPVFQDFQSHIKASSEEKPPIDPIAELVQKAARLKEKFPRALSAM